MRSLKVLLLSLALQATAYAAGIPFFGSQLGGLLSGNSGPGATSSIQTLLLNAGLNYAKGDQKYADILTALGISNASDLQKFLKGEASGANFRDIIVHAAFQYTQMNPPYTEWLVEQGVVDEPGLRAFLNGKGGNYQDLISSWALEYAHSNSQYATWLEQLRIVSISDVNDILNGGLEGSNLQATILSFGQSYLQSNPKYARYALFLSLLLGDSSLTQGSGSTELFLGAYDGLPISEIKTIQKSKNLKVRTKDQLTLKLNGSKFIHEGGA